MAVICVEACAPPAINGVVTSGGCNPIIRNKAIKRIVFIRCDIDPATVIIDGSVDAADVLTALATAYGAGTNSTAFVSPTGIMINTDQADQIEVKLDDCGKIYYVDGEYTITMQFKYGWDITPAAIAPAVDEYGEEIFWKAIKVSQNSWNFGFVDCNGDLGYFMTSDETTFATGTVSVKDLTPEEVSDCLKISSKEVTLKFKCGAVQKRILTLTDPDFDSLIDWA